MASSIKIPGEQSNAEVMAQLLALIKAKDNKSNEKTVPVSGIGSDSIEDTFTVS